MTEVDSCFVLKGNIVLSRLKGSENKLGTRLFRPNAKVYLAGLKHNWTVVNPDKNEAIPVLGQHRKSRKWIVAFVRSTHVENWRVAVEANPEVVARLRQEEWPGFNLEYSDEYERTSSKAIEELLKSVLESAHRNWLHSQ